MPSLWWNLPSPSSFIEEAATDLREGRNVFLMLPEINPNELYQALKLELQKENLGSLERLSAIRLSTNSPAQELFRVYDFDIYSIIKSIKIDIAQFDME